jgi:hypothetical protein
MAEFEEDTQGDEGSNLLEEFQLNKDEEQGELGECNYQQPEVGHQQHINVQCNDLPLGLNNWVYVPQTPAVAPYQAYLATGTLNHPPFVTNHSAGKFTADDYYQHMIISRMERQELEE